MALFLSGFVVMDPFSLPRAEWTTHGTVHQLLGAFAFTLMPVTGIVLAWRWRRDAAWRGFRWWTIAIVVVLLIALVLLRAGPAIPPAAPTVFNPWRGLIQRGILIPFMAWLFTLAIAMVRGPRESPTVPVGTPQRRVHDPAPKDSAQPGTAQSPL